jgi:hypothetical protein
MPSERVAGEQQRGGAPGPVHLAQPHRTTHPQTPLTTTLKLTASLKQCNFAVPKIQRMRAAQIGAKRDIFAELAVAMSINAGVCVGLGRRSYSI